MKLNSERVKNKNFKDLNGKPLFKWVLDSLCKVQEIDLVVINTDAKEKLESEGIRDSDRILIRERKKSLCGDFTSMNLIIQDDIESIPSQDYLMTHTTNPFISSETISNAFNAYKGLTNDYDSLFSVNKIQTRFYSKDCVPINHNPNELSRTQDLEPWFEENSCLYFFNQVSFRNTKARIGKSPQMYVTPTLESIDIDNLSDWIIADALAKNI